MSIDKQVKEITSRDKDFAKWYTDVCKKADLACSRFFMVDSPFNTGIG